MHTPPQPPGLAPRRRRGPSSERGVALFVVIVMAALPTAQNIFTYSLRYQRAVYLTRDAIFVTTLGSAPVILLAALIFQGA